MESCIKKLRSKNRILKKENTELRSKNKGTGKHHAEQREKFLGAALSIIVSRLDSPNELKEVCYSKNKFSASKLTREIEDCRRSYGIDDDSPAFGTIEETLRKHIFG